MSVSKDGMATIFSIDGKIKRNLIWSPPAEVRYLFKRCRFGKIEDKTDSYRLFTISNPLSKSGRTKGFLQSWNTATGRLDNILPVDENLSALAVRDDGRFIAVGTMFRLVFY